MRRVSRGRLSGQSKTEIVHCIYDHRDKPDRHRCSKSSTLSSWYGPSPSPPMWHCGSILNFDVDLLRLNCVVSSSALLTYCVKLFGFVLMLLDVIGAHCKDVLIFHRGRFRERQVTLLCVAGTIIMGVFISLSAAIFAQGQCEEHPNGDGTVRTYGQILCWTRDFVATVTNMHRSSSSEHPRV